MQPDQYNIDQYQARERKASEQEPVFLTKNCLVMDAHKIIK